MIHLALSSHWVKWYDQLWEQGLEPRTHPLPGNDPLPWATERSCLLDLGLFPFWLASANFSRRMVEGADGRSTLEEVALTRQGRLIFHVQGKSLNYWARAQQPMALRLGLACRCGASVAFGGGGCSFRCSPHTAMGMNTSGGRDLVPTHLHPVWLTLAHNQKMYLTWH